MLTKPNGDVEHTLRLGWACYYRRGDKNRPDSEEWKFFTTSSDFWTFLFSRVKSSTKLWCIARNLSFDFTILGGWSQLKSSSYKLKFFYSKGATTIISVDSDHSSIVFLDSMNWFAESLENTGRRIGIPKMSVDFSSVKDSELSTYCKNDVLIELENFKLFIRFLIDNSIARLCYTQGSTAMAAYLKSHYHGEIWIHNNSEAISLEREAYKGGRVEAFHLGELSDGPFTVVDVNSLYPFVMRDNLYPCKYITQLHYPTIPELQSLLIDNSVVACVKINTDLPVYPVRTERTLFPVGTFEASLCTPELIYALDHNHIISITHAVVYERADLFSSYVNTLYKLRLKFKASGNEAYVELCKKLMNTLYGKFGQKAEEWVKIGDCPDEPDHYEYLIYADRPGKTSVRYLMGEVFEQVGKGESYDSFPAIAAHVTANGRMKLWSLMQLAGKGNYYYCDTDSLIVNNVGLKRLKPELSNTELGKLKVVESSSKLIIHGLKDYVTDSKTVVKGIRKKAVKVDNDNYVQDKWPSIQGRLRAGLQGPYTVEKQTKHLSRAYTKGKVLPDGSVIPVVFPLDSVDCGSD